MGDIFITGNTAIDAMQYTVNRILFSWTALLNELDFQNHRIIAVTCHRRENYGKPMEDIIMHAILKSWTGRCGGNAQSHCPLLYGHDGFRRIAGGSTCHPR